jgi:hypothetical protein
MDAMSRERAAWTLAGWLGAALIAILTIMLGFIGSSQNQTLKTMVEAHKRQIALQRRVNVLENFIARQFGSDALRDIRTIKILPAKDD